MKNFIIKYKKVLIATTILIIILGIACILLYKPMMDILRNPQQLSITLQNLGIWGVLAMILIIAIQVVFAFLPGEIVEVLAGFIFGNIAGMLICIIGMGLGTMIIFGLTRLIGESFLYRMIDRDKLLSVSFLQNHQRLEMILFIIFFIPGTPKDLITYFAPLLNINLIKFLLITSIARIPSIVTSTISGNALNEQNYVLSVLVFVITGIISLFGIYFYHNHITKDNKEIEV